MVRILLDLLLTGMQCFLTGITFCYVCRVKRRGQFLLVLCALVIALHLVSVYVFLEYIAYKPVLQIIIIAGVPLLYSEEKKGKSLCAVLVVVCVMLALEFVGAPIWDMLMPIGAYEALLGENDLWFILIKLFYLLLYAPALAGLAWLWNRVARRGESGGMVVGLALFPFSQAVLIGQVCITRYLMGEQTVAIYIICILNFVICVAADLLLLREIRRLRKLHEVEQRQLQVEQHMVVQENYYRYLEEKVAAVSKLRHDMNNQLQTAFTLLRQQEGNVAREQLEHLQQRLADTRPRRYSSNPIIDAVLEDKAERCEELGVEPTCHLDLPTVVNIEPPALCSVLSNLLDNALRGCETCEGRRFIHCEGMTRGEYIVIEVVNAKGSLPPRMTGHGLGLVILQEIAATYGGKLETKDEENCFTATIWLCLREERAVCTVS